MSSILPQRQPCRPGPADVPVPRPRFFKTVAGFVLSGFVRGKIRRGDTNMDSLRRLLDQYLSIIPPVDQEDILVNFNQMEETKKNLSSRSLSLLEHYETAKVYERRSVRALEIAKEASDRAHNTELVSRMARDTGLTDFSVDHPFHGLYRAPSTTSDWSDCTLLVATGGSVPTDGRDTPTGDYLNLPSSASSDHLSSIVGEEGNSSSSRPESPRQTLVASGHWEMWSNAS